MDYREIKLLKQTEKSTVSLVQEQDGERLFIRKRLKGRHAVYETLQGLSHPFLPKLYEVEVSEDSTTVMEEYIEGENLEDRQLTKKQFLGVVKELCAVLEFLHGQGIIHRDIKPANLILAKDGHIRLIDFDAARMPKPEKGQDTQLLGTRGFAPPEQYGFSQTDERTDIYALGVTLEQLLGENAGKSPYKKILYKCTDLDPDKRYQSVCEVERAFFKPRRYFLCAAAVFAALLLCGALWHGTARETARMEEGGLTVLPVPKEAHWDQDTGFAMWRNVPESGEGDDVKYGWKLYRRDTPTPPDPNADEGEVERSMRGRGGEEFFNLHLSCEFWDNGYYYFAVCASGDGVTYADSPYVLSDAFEYTGADAPRLPEPEDLSWIVKQEEESTVYFAAFTNFDDYVDKDNIQVFVYDEEGEWVNSSFYKKEELVENGWPGIRIPAEYVNQRGKSYSFAIQVTSSRPNTYRASPEVFPWESAQDYLSPWLRNE